MDNAVSVALNSTRQMILWPGHYPMANDAAVVGATGTMYPAQMDEVAYHQGLFQVSGGAYAGNYNVGPGDSVCADGTTVSHSAAVMSPDLASSANGATVGVSTNHTNFLWDNPLPIVANIAVGGHLRWKMIAQGIRIRNITPAEQRGGCVVSVQPNFQVNMADHVNQAKFSTNPSWHNWGDGSQEIVITWIPRTRDLAYWHLDNTTSAAGVAASTPGLSGPGVLIWFNAPAAYAQTYEFNHWAHWEIAGVGVQIFSNGTVGSAVSDGQAKQAIAAHAMTGPTAAGFATTVRRVVTTGSANLENLVAQKGRQIAREGLAAVGL
jgi:hypothetical protein